MIENMVKKLLKHYIRVRVECSSHPDDYSIDVSAWKEPFYNSKSIAWLHESILESEDYDMEGEYELDKEGNLVKYELIDRREY